MATAFHDHFTTQATMFLGEYQHTLDSKGRLTIPSPYRLHLAAGLVVTRGLDHNLTIYTRERWQTLADQIDGKGFSNLKVRRLRRFVFGRAVEANLDRQGRVLVPANLRAHARIESEVVVVGNHSYFELWEPGAWEAHQEALNEEDPEILFEGIDF